MEKTFLGTTANNKIVYLRPDLFKEAAYAKIACPMNMLIEALSKVTVDNEPYYRYEVIFNNGERKRLSMEISHEEVMLNEYILVEAHLT